jgi:hypothetical protein
MIFGLLLWSRIGKLSALTPVTSFETERLLRKTIPGGTLVVVKRWILMAIAVLGLAGAAYWYLGGWSFVSAHLGHLWSGNAPAEAASAGPDKSAPITWQTVERPDEGFRIDLPSDPKDLEVPAYNESGGSEPIKMLVASPDGDTTFAVSWEDNPPVARVNNRLPERTLEMARDGMLARTRTMLGSESRLMFKGYPSREISARNASGGLLNARLIFAGERLYTLMALFPSNHARREQDVKHFFSSFQPAGPTIPEAIPAASNSGD